MKMLLFPAFVPALILLAVRTLLTLVPAPAPTYLRQCSPWLRCAAELRKLHRP